jgi:hypothetical protein
VIWPTLRYPDDYLHDAQLSENISLNNNKWKQSDFEEESARSAIPLSEDKRVRELEGAASAIGRLNRLSLAIRGASMLSGFSPVVGFVVRDEDVIESTGSRQQFEVDLTWYFQTVLTHRYWHLSERQRNKLADLLSLRRRRLLYIASHKKKPHVDPVKPIPAGHQPTTVAQDPGAANEMEFGQQTESQPATFNQRHYAPMPSALIASS